MIFCEKKRKESIIKEINRLYEEESFSKETITVSKPAFLVGNGINYYNEKNFPGRNY